MPVYELLCLARPALARPALEAMLRRLGGLVQEQGGVVTNVTSYGEQDLAYSIRGVHGKYSQVSRSAAWPAAAPPGRERPRQAAHAVGLGQLESFSA